MARFGFCGPTYTSASVNADCQRCVNFIPEVNESGQGNAAIILLPTPGLSVFAALPDLPARGLFEFNGRCFAVGGARFCEIQAGGVVVNIGAVVNDGKPASMVANQANQVLIASGGTIYLYDLATNIFSQPSGAPTGINIVEFSDGYFVALSANSNQWQLSNSLDGTIWSGINVAKISVYAENIVSMIATDRQLVFFGNKRSVVYYDSGNTFPYDVVPGGFIEQGCAATYSPVRMDNSIFWLGKDERGQGIAWRNNGYTPQRISNHAIEQTWATYPRIDDAIGYSYQDGGHTFYHLYFPSANASWRYDAATQMWHEPLFWDVTRGTYTAHHSQCHVFAFGKHLVGDWKTGNVYQMDTAFLNDFGNPIRRMRRSPHVGTLGKRTFHNSLQLFCEVGLGPQPPLTGPNLGPPKAPNSIILADVNGGLWQVTIDDNGNPNRIQVSSGTPQVIILADSAMVPSTAWEIIITVDGNLDTESVTQDSGGGYGASYGADPYGSGPGSGGSSLSQLSQIYPMASVPGNHLTGFLVTPDGNIQTNKPNLARDPRVSLRYSRDWGHTWSNEMWKGIGQAGQYMKRVIWRRLGWSWDRVYEIVFSDPVPFRIVDADLDATGFQPTERLVHQLRKGA
jgi:hypothetical protein